MNNAHNTATLLHLRALFLDCAPYSDGMIEVAYTDVTGKPNKAELFEASDIEKAVCYAQEKNRSPGVNVYIGASLRQPDAQLFKRCDSSDFYAATALWVDIDDGDAAERASEIYKELPPSFIVVTGTYPKKRLQLWWRLREPEPNKATVKKALSGICHAFSGDKAVVDPIRIMRAAGTTAWPYKEGRVQETTEFVVPANASKTVSIDQIFSLWPEPLLMIAPSDDKPRNLLTNRLDIRALLDRTKETGHWHQNMRDAIASMVGSGYPDEIIRLSCSSYCIDSFIDADLTPLINSAREKWGMPDPDNSMPPAGEWPDPQPIQAPLKPVLPFDFDTLLPESLRGWVKDAAGRMPCPPDFIAAAAIVTLGSLIGARCAIKPKEKDDWLIVPNLWGGIVGSPSVKKSPAITEATKPLDRLVAIAIERQQMAENEFEAINIIHEAQKDEITSRLKGAVKKQKGGIIDEK